MIAVAGSRGLDVKGNGLGGQVSNPRSATEGLHPCHTKAYWRNRLQLILEIPNNVDFELPRTDFCCSVVILPVAA